MARRFVAVAGGGRLSAWWWLGCAVVWAVGCPGEAPTTRSVDRSVRTEDAAGEEPGSGVVDPPAPVTSEGALGLLEQPASGSSEGFQRPPGIWDEGAQVEGEFERGTIYVRLAVSWRRVRLEAWRWKPGVAFRAPSDGLYWAEVRDANGSSARVPFDVPTLRPPEAAPEGETEWLEGDRAFTTEAQVMLRIPAVEPPAAIRVYRVDGTYLGEVAVR